MNAALRDYVLLWRMALSAQRRRMHVILLCVVVLLAAMVGFLVQVKEGDPMLTLGVSVRIVLGGMLAGMVVYFLLGAVKLNTPANARLVPRMRRRLLEAAAIAWAAATGLATLLACDTPVSPALVFLGTGSVTAIIALASTGHRAGLNAQFAVFPLVFLVPKVATGLVQNVTHGLGLLTATLLMLAFSAFTLGTMFMNGGEQHHALRKRQELLVERLSPKGQFKATKPSPIIMRAYFAVLRRDCAGHDMRKLLPHLLGGREHWTYQALALAGVTALLAAALLAFRAYGGEATRAMLANGGWVFAFGLLLIPLFEHERRNIRLTETAGEQGLLRLAPRMPASAAVFNRSLARTTLANAVLGWCLQVAAAMVLALAAGATAWLTTLLCLCCLTLPLIGTNLRQHARAAGLLGLAPALCLLLSAGASFTVGAWLRTTFDIPIMTGAAFASVLIAAVAVPWRWKRSVEAPIAFPVGRLA